MNNLFVEFAISQIGVRYKFQGRIENEGIDCFGLFTCACKKYNIPYYDETNYRLKVEKEQSKRLIESNFIEIRKEDLKVGDFIGFNTLDRITHIGIVEKLNPLTYIHAPIKEKKVVRTVFSNESVYSYLRYKYV